MEERIPINTERTYLYNTEINVCFKAEIDIHISRDQAQNALNQLVHRHPLLTSTIVFNEKNEAFYNLYSAKPIVIDYESKENKWEEWVKGCNQNPLDFSQGPLLKLYVYSKDKSATILFLGHHLMGDGYSYYFIMTDFLGALDGSLSDEVLVPQLIKGNRSLKKDCRLGFLPRYYAKRTSRSFGKRGIAYTFEDYQKAFFRDQNERKPEMAIFSLDKAHTSSLIQKAKSNGITVNQVLTTAYVHSKERHYKTSDYIGIACSVRSDLIHNPGKSLGNFVSGIAINTTYNHELDFWDNTKVIGERINDKLKNKRTKNAAIGFLDSLSDSLIDSLYLEDKDVCHMGEVVSVRDRLSGVPNDQGLGISNLGRLVMEYDNFKLISSHFIPPLFSQNDLIVGLVTINGQLHSCIRYKGCDLSEKQVQDIYTDAMNLALNE